MCNVFRTKTIAVDSVTHSPILWSIGLPPIAIYKKGRTATVTKWPLVV